MSQSDYNVANADGATVRADINSQLDAIGSQNSGSTAPPVTFPFMRWFDTANQQLKERNGANTAWRIVAEVVDGELVPYSAGESADERYARLVGPNDFSEMPAVDGEALITEAAALDAIPPAVNAAIAEDIDFTIIYPNGGSAESPANIAANMRYVEENPFPGHYVQCRLEVWWNGMWTMTGLETIGSASSRGSDANQLGGGDIIVQTCVNSDASRLASYNGAPHGLTSGTINWPLPSRVLVWKIKGATA